jgi:hypothetical protein
MIPTHIEHFLHCKIERTNQYNYASDSAQILFVLTVDVYFFLLYIFGVLGIVYTIPGGSPLRD